MTLNELIGQAVKRRRELLGMSQRNLQAACNIRPNTVSAIEHGKGNPQLGSIIKVLDALGLELRIVESVPPDQLVNVGRNMRRLRFAADRTIAECAEAAGINADRWKRLEAGKAMPDARLIESIAGVFGVKQDELTRECKADG